MKTVSRIYATKAAKPIKPRRKIATKHRAFGSAYSLDHPNFMLVNNDGSINKLAQKKLAKLGKDEARKIKQFMVSYKVQGKPLSYKEANWAIHDPQTKLSIFMHNMGVDYNDVLEQLDAQGYDLSADYILNSDNWVFNKFANGDATLSLPDGNRAYFVFQYHAGFIIEVQRTAGGQLA